MFGRGSDAYDSVVSGVDLDNDAYQGINSSHVTNHLLAWDESQYDIAPKPADSECSGGYLDLAGHVNEAYISPRQQGMLHDAPGQVPSELGSPDFAGRRPGHSQTVLNESACLYNRTTATVISGAIEDEEEA